MKREKAFISYSHKDKRLFGEFKTMLAPAIRNGVVEIWDDTKIVPGANWKEEIEKALRSARIAVLLVSANFLDSEFIANNELPPLLKAAQDDGVTIFWIYLSSCLYEQTEIVAYQAAHDIARPLDSLKRSERLAVISETCAKLLRLARNPQAGSSEVGGADPLSHRTAPLISATPQLRDASPLGREDKLSRDYSDKTVKSVAAALNEAKPLTMRSLVLNLDVLFNRGTFRFEPLRDCVTQEWGRRLLPAMETLELLRSYSSFVSDLAPDARTFEKLMDAVNGYCLAMATDLFEEPVRVSEMRDYLGTTEFLTRLPQGKRWASAGEIDNDTNKRVDGPRARAVRQMDQLRKEFLKAPRKEEFGMEPISAVKVWRAKLEFLLVQEARASDAEQKFKLRQDIAEARSKIRELESEASANATSDSIPFRADISRIVKYAPVELIGREAETKILADAWEQAVRGETKRPHVLTFVALGGEGKTSLVAKWTADLAYQGWPGCDAAFAWSFYSQGTREQLAASSDLFLKEALTFFGDTADKEFAASPAGAFEKGQRLARIVGQRRSLLILDGLEPLQYSTSATAFKAGELKDQGIAKLLKDLATASQGLCIVTTRVEIPDLQLFRGGAVIETHLKRLPRNTGVDLLKRLGVKGSDRRNLPVDDDDPDSEKVNEFEKLVEDVKGHALTLTLLGGFLKRAFNGDIRQRDRVKFEKADEKMDGGHAFRTMAAYEHWLLGDGGDEGRREVAVLRLMGLFDRPADAGYLAALRSESIAGLTEPLAGLADDDWEYCLSGLEAAKLLTVNRDAFRSLVSLDAHPHLREYFARQLRKGQPDAWRAAHQRLYEHLCATTNEGDQPTLEDLQPLYLAVAHGCQAGLQQEVHDKVFWGRIERNYKSPYATQKLGVFASHLSALACFFEKPWSRLSKNLKERSQGVMLANAAFYLRALGRLGESLEPIREAATFMAKLQEWEQAARAANNLSELKVTLGDLALAVGDAEEAVTYADRSGDAFERMISRTAHADALHQAGYRDQAETRFREAEQIQTTARPEYPLLYSVPGFRYCDLLLAAPERAAWLGVLNSSHGTSHSSRIDSCRAISQRSTQTLKWVSNYGQDILSPSLDHLTLARAALYELVLAVGGLPSKTQDSEVKTSIDAAVDGLRRAGTTHHIPRALLTRAWLRFLTRVRTGSASAQEDLDEAWEIAERGPMRLFMADIHLYRARLFGGMKDEGGGMKYPWDKNPDGTPRGPKDDLAAARKLIEQCGYWRRKEELEDAEEAAKSW